MERNKNSKNKCLHIITNLYPYYANFELVLGNFNKNRYRQEFMKMEAQFPEWFVVFSYPY